MLNIPIDLIIKLRNLTSLGILECKNALYVAKGDINLAIDYLHKSGEIKAINKINSVTSEGIIVGKVNNKNTHGVIIQLNCETDFVARNTSLIDFSTNIVAYILNKNIFDINLIKKQFENERISLVNKLNENIILTKINILKGNYIELYIHRDRIGVLVSSSKYHKSLIKHIAMHIAASNPLYITELDIPENFIKKEKKIFFNLSRKSNKSIELSNKIADGKFNKLMKEICLYKQSFIMDQNITVSKLLSKHDIKIINFIRFAI